MGEERVIRKLAAIFAADMVGYSRHMEADEEGTIARHRAHRRELMDPAIAAHSGRVVKTTGDGLLVEFSSAVDAVQCAVEVQRAVADQEADASQDRRIAYRVGVNIGDIVIDGDDILGDGVNVAARLEGLCEPGGVCVSDVVYQSIEGKLDLAFDDLGRQSVKSIKRPVHAWQWRGGGARPDPMKARGAGDAGQEIRFCTAPDGVRIAYATVGSGPPLVKAPNWMNHLEYEWKSPVWRHMLEEFSQDHTLIRFDQRGNGLSDWDVENISFDAFVSDLESIVDALELEHFDLFGMSQGSAISIAYAVRHPERVDRLILLGGFARGFLTRGSDKAEEYLSALTTLLRRGWDHENPAFRQMFTSRFLPGGTQEQVAWFNELQRVCISPENAIRHLEVMGRYDVTDLLPKVTTPTLVLHCREDDIIPFSEGRKMAAMIPGARFVPLEGKNHFILEQEPAWPRFLSEVRDFLGTEAPG